MGHPDADPKLIGRNIHVMLTPLPVNKRKPKFHLETEQIEEADANDDASSEGESKAAAEPSSGT
jgi:translation initiation factor IF-3